MIAKLGSVKSLFSGKTSAGATIQTFSVKIFIIVINIGTGITTARILGPNGRGELAAMGLWPQLLAFTLSLGLPRSLLYNLRNSPEKESELFTCATILSIGLGIFATVVGIIFIPFWLSEYSINTIRHAQILMLIAPIPLLGIIFKYSFEAKGEFTLSNRAFYFHPLMTLSVVFFLVVLDVRDPFYYSLGYCLPQVPIVLWMFFELKKRFNITFKGFFFTSKKLMNYALRSYGVDLINLLSTQIGQVLAVGSLSAGAMGMYTIALNLTRPLNTFEKAINAVLFPKAASRSTPEIVKLIGQGVRISLALTTICVIPLAIICPLLLPLLYGDEFLEAVSTFRILLVQVLLEGATLMLSQAFMASNRPGVVTILQIGGLSIVVPSMLWLVPTYGMNGVALALLISSVARLILILSCYPLILKERPPKLLISHNDIDAIYKNLFPSQKEAKDRFRVRRKYYFNKNKGSKMRD